MRPYLKNNESKQGLDMAQVVAHLPNNHKTLSSNPSTPRRHLNHLPLFHLLFLSPCPAAFKYCVCIQFV
jgi:hypothetical protein